MRLNRCSFKVFSMQRIAALHPEASRSRGYKQIATNGYAATIIWI